MTAYIVWRVGWSWHGASRWLWGMLLVAEAYGLWGLADPDLVLVAAAAAVRPAATPVTGSTSYVCTYDEPEAVLRATLAGCAALTYPHTTWLLDDGRRPEIAELAAHWGART